MRAGERAELEEMRERIINRMNDLQDQVDAGTLTDEQRYEQLRAEFGEHYHKTLNEITELLSTDAPRPQIEKKLPAFIGVVLALAIAATALLGSGPTGAVIQEQTTKIDVALADGQATTLALPDNITITDVRVTSSEQSSYTLSLEDETGTHELLTSKGCPGCGASYNKPYILSAQTDGAVQVQSISYEVAR